MSDFYTKRYRSDTFDPKAVDRIIATRLPHQTDTVITYFQATRTRDGDFDIEVSFRRYPDVDCGTPIDRSFWNIAYPVGPGIPPNWTELSE